MAHDGGIFFGQNASSGNLIMCNKEKLLNPNAFILGVPGSGKSFNAKENIVFLALSTDDDILICDPEREYAALIEALGGEVIRIAPGSEDHINAMDMVEGYGDGKNPIIEKSQFVLSIFEQLEKNGITSSGKSIIDRCTREIYEDYQNGGKVPTLCVLSMELFTDGSLNAFAHETNVDMNNRMIVYDILDLGEHLKTMGLLVITDAMLNRVSENWKKGKRTHLFIDEFHVVFQNEYSANFFNSAWRRFRKRNALPTAITQNVDFILQDVLARTMISNSEFIVMLNQAPNDSVLLGELLNISDEQLKNVTVEEYRKLGLGFRDIRLFETTKMILEKQVDLEDMKKNQNTMEVRDELLKLSGVGPKVADCILLFSDLKRFEVFPIDVWVRRVMNDLYIKQEDETKVSKKQIEKIANEKFGDLAGLAQQYLFYWRREA